MTFLRSPRGTVILLLSAVFVAFGFLQLGEGSVPLVYTGIGLFLFYYVSRLVLQIKIAVLNKTGVNRYAAPSISEDKRLSVGLKFTNPSSIGIRLEVFDSYPPFFRLKSGSNSAIITVPGKGYSILRYELGPTSIGKQEFGSLHVVMRDLAGLFFYERDIEGKSPIEVNPRTRELARGALTATSFSTYSGPIVTRRKGEGMEFADIREYSFGDPYKRIEWKATARTGELMVRQLHAETQLNIMILLEASETMAYGEAGQTKLDYAARAIASLIAYLSRRGDFFGLTVLQGGQPCTVIPIARGQAQVNRILNRLGRLEPAPVGRKALGEAVSSSLRLGKIKGRTLFFVLTDLENLAELMSLRQLLVMRHETVIVSPYTPLFESHNLKGLDKMIFAVRTAQNWPVRQQLVNEAAKYGIPLFDVGPKDMFSSLVKKVEEQRRLGGS